VVEDGRLTRVDEMAIVEEAQRSAERIGPAAAAAFWSVNGPNAEAVRAERL
jgi:hypothetical protein